MLADQAVSILRELSAVCRQGERGYLAAAAAVRTDSLQAALERYGRQRSRLADELENLAVRVAAAERSAAVRTFGAWQDLSRMQGIEDSAVLAECLNSEGISRERYDRALEQDLPLNVKMVVLRQYAEIKSALQWLRRAEIQARARWHALH